MVSPALQVDSLPAEIQEAPKVCGDKVKAVLKGKFIEGNTLEMRDNFKSIIKKIFY